jgi:hypothetical protein
MLGAWPRESSLWPSDKNIGDRKIRDRNSIPYFSVPYIFIRWKTKVFNGGLAIHEKAEIGPFFALFILRSSPLH